MVYHLSLVLLFLITTISAFQHTHQLPPALTRRAPSYGGYSLASETCPAGLTTCPAGKYCPANTICRLAGTEAGYACCPDAANCVPAVRAAPACADDSWMLWGGVNGFFCCTKDQIGILPNKGQARVGFCVASNVPVAATQSATRIDAATSESSGATTATASSSESRSASTSVSSAPVTTSIVAGGPTITAAVVTSPTTTRSGSVVAATGAANVAQAEGLLAGIVGGLGSVLLMVLF